MTLENNKSSGQKDGRSGSPSNSSQQEKKSKKKSSKMREKSTSAKQKSTSAKQNSITKGLSPPQSKSRKRSFNSKEEALQSRPTDPTEREADKTQWEFTRFKDEAIGGVEDDPNVYVAEKVGEATPFIAEQKQIMMKQGEHLKEKPMYTLFFLFLEMILAMTVLVAWTFFLYENELVPIILCFTNVIILLIVLILLFAIQFGRFNVVEEELDGDSRFRIPYQWKYWICVMHVLRFFLICANITIGSLDNNFDGGVIVLISGMPIMLIISAGHVLFALLPQIAPK